MKSIFNMSFDEQCRSFNEFVIEKTLVQTEERLFFCKWSLSSVNNHIRKWLNKNGYPYFHHMQSSIVFTDDGVNWFKAIPIVENDEITVYRGVYH